MLTWLGVAVVVLALASLVLGLVQRLLRMALVFAVFGVILAGVWVVLYEFAPPSVRGGVKRASEQGAQAVERLGRDAAAAGVELAKEVARSRGSRDTDAAPIDAADGPAGP